MTQYLFHLCCEIYFAYCVRWEISNALPKFKPPESLRARFEIFSFNISWHMDLRGWMDLHDGFAWLSAE